MGACVGRDNSELPLLVGAESKTNYRTVGGRTYANGELTLVTISSLNWLSEESSGEKFYQYRDLEQFLAIFRQHSLRV